MTDCRRRSASASSRASTTMSSVATCLRARYDELLAQLPLQLPASPGGNRSAFHLYVVRLHLR